MLWKATCDNENEKHENEKREHETYDNEKCEMKCVKMKCMNMKAIISNGYKATTDIADESGTYRNVKQNVKRI